jgi:pilus assembly protein Flp/PilA
VAERGGNMDFIRNEEGQGMVEYGLILGLIAIVVIGALTATGTSVNSLFSYVSGRVTT